MTPHNCVVIAARTVAVDDRGRPRRLKRHVALGRERAAAQIDVRTRRLRQRVELTGLSRLRLQTP
jgi:hypothetical protein